MRVLLSESDRKLATSIKTRLEEQGHTVDLAHAPTEGNEPATVDHHDVIILDVMPPDRDGVKLCRQLRRQGVGVPILLLSVSAATADRVAALDAGADDFLTKPFDLDELLARLRSLLRRSQGVIGAVLRSGDLVMDLLERRVTLRGVEVRLSAKEFALLHYMMRNPRKMLTRAMISESVWGMNHESGSNVIDVYISSLRRKIDQDPNHRRIETVIGSGYRFLDSRERGADTTR